MVRSTLAPFDCTRRNGISTMDAEPTVVCGEGASYYRMRDVAAVSMLAYGIGVPAAFAFFLRTNRVAIRDDQRLRQRGEGELAITNPNLHIRR